MTNITNKCLWSYPADKQDPWYDDFEAMVNAQDQTAYAAREDRQLVLSSFAKFSFDSGTGVLTWDATIDVVSSIAGRLVTISAGSATLADGEVLYATITRAPVTNVSAAVTVASTVPNLDNAYVIAVRRSTDVFFRTGRKISGGQTGIDIFSSGGTSVPVIVPASQPKRIYVRSAGNDTTGDGLTSGTAYLTIERALRDVPTNIGERSYVVDLSGYGDYHVSIPVDPRLNSLMNLPDYTGSGDLFFDYSLFYSFVYGNLSFYAEPTVDDTILNTSHNVHQPVNPYTNQLYIQDSTKAWTIDQWKGYYAIDGAGNDAPIVSNTADTLSVASDSYGFTPDEIRIVHPSCVLFGDGAGTSVINIGNSTAGVRFIGIGFLSMNPMTQTPLIVRGGYESNLGFELCTAPIVNQASYYGYSSKLTLRACYFYSPGWLYSSLCADTIIIDSCLVESVAYPTDAGSILEINGSMFLNCGGSIGDGDPYWRDFHASVRIVNSSITGGYGIKLTERVTSGYLSYVRVDGVTGDGVLVESTNAKISSLTGTGSSQYGLKLTGLSDVRISGTNGIAGDFGEILVGSLPPRTWASFNGGSVPHYNEHDITDQGSKLWDPSLPSAYWPILPGFTSEGGGATRPTISSAGAVVFNSSYNSIDVHDGSSWRNIPTGFSFYRVIAQPADGSSFMVTLPHVLPSAAYSVVANVIKSTDFVIVRCPTVLGPDRITTEFKCETSMDLDDGDIIEFIVMMRAPTFA